MVKKQNLINDGGGISKQKRDATATKKGRNKSKKDTTSIHLKKMPLDEFQKITGKEIKTFSAKQVLELLLWHSWALTKEQIDEISPESIKAITPKDLQHFTPKTLRLMNTRQLKTMTIEQIHSLRPIQIAALSPDQLTCLSKKQVQALLPSHIAALSSSQIFSLVTSGKLAAMSSKQFTDMPQQTRTRIRLLKSQLFPRRIKPPTPQYASSI
jgi:hypothetical protein